MRLELGTVLRDLATLGQAEDLIAAAVSQDRAGPTDEAMQSAAPRDQVITGTKVQMIGVAASSRSLNSVPFTAPCVPTGMKAGVRTTP